MDTDSRPHSSIERAAESIGPAAPKQVSALADTSVSAGSFGPTAGETQQVARRREPIGEKALEGWKDIATYFGVVDRTAQLWEQTRGLPVRRKRGPRGRVYAYPSELAAWYQATVVAETGSVDANHQNPEESLLGGAGRQSGDGDKISLPVGGQGSFLQQEPGDLVSETPTLHARRPRSWFRPGAITALGFGLIFLFAIASWIATALVPAPLSYLRVHGRFISAYSPEDRVLWRHPLPFDYFERHPPGSAFLPVRPLIADLDGDGRPEALAWDAVPNESGSADTLYCFSADGRLRWTFQPSRTVESARGSMTPTYNGRILTSVRYGGGKMGVLAAAYHRPYYPTQVVLISAEGEVLREYWHTGYLLAAAVADLDKDGRDEIYLGGISNAYEAPTLIVLDPDMMDGASRDPIDPTYELLGFPPPREVARIILPRTALSRCQEPYSLLQHIGVYANELVVTVIEGKSDASAHGSLWFHFNPALQLTGVSRGDNHAQLWEVLRSEGALSHPWSEADHEALSQVQYLPGTSLDAAGSYHHAD